jgi:hypothetical protein
MIAIRMKASAAAVGYSSCTRYWFCTTLPIIVVFGDPRYCAFTKSPAAGMNVSSPPANTPGSESGRTTLRNARQPLEYRSVAASTKPTSIFSSAT